MSQKLSLIMGALCTTLLPPALFYQHAFDRALADDQQIIRMLEQAEEYRLMLQKRHNKKH